MARGAAAAGLLREQPGHWPARAAPSNHHKRPAEGFPPVGYDGSMAVSLATYEQVALEDGDVTWEYVSGRLREEPGMTQEHNDTAFYLAHQLASQLDREQFILRSNAGRLQTLSGNEYVPNVVVVPTRIAHTQAGSGKLESHVEPLPFVAEVWSKSTGAYDIDTKLPDYLARGDEVVWRVHPYEKTVRAWTRQPDGAYLESEHAGGVVAIASLPGVAIDLAELFS